jgi:hypothetical protein
MISKIKNIFRNKMRSDLRFAFKSVSGKNYYYIIDLENQDKPEISKLPFARYLVYSEFIWEYWNGLKNEEFDMWFEQAEKINDIRVMKVAIEALKFRKNIAINIDLIYEILALVYIREDDPKGALTSDQIKERAWDIKNTAETGHFFFHYSELLALLNFQKQLGMSWVTLLKNLEMQKQVFQRAMDSIVKSTP